MKTKEITMTRYDADEGKVFDWLEPRFEQDPEFPEDESKQVQSHLYAKTLFIGANDNILNYIEVAEPVKAPEAEAENGAEE